MDKIPFTKETRSSDKEGEKVEIFHIALQHGRRLRGMSVNTGLQGFSPRRIRSTDSTLNCSVDTTVSPNVCVSCVHACPAALGEVRAQLLE